LKNIGLIIIFALILGYAYVTISERQEQRLIRQRRPKIQDMVNKYEFRRSLYQIRQTRERLKEEESKPQAAEEKPVMNPVPPAEDNLRNDEEYLNKLKEEQATPAQPIEQPADNNTELRREIRSRYALPPGRDEEGPGPAPVPAPVVAPTVQPQTNGEAQPIEAPLVPDQAAPMDAAVATEQQQQQPQQQSDR